MTFRKLLNPSQEVSRWLQLLQWAVISLILIASFIPGSAVTPGRWNAGHLPSYLILTVVKLVMRRHSSLRLNPIIRVLVAISGMGLAIELIQPLVGRTTSLSDLALNEAGVAMGVVMYCVYMLVAKRLRTQAVPTKIK